MRQRTKEGLVNDPHIAVSFFQGHSLSVSSRHVHYTSRLHLALRLGYAFAPSRSCFPYVMTLESGEAYRRTTAPHRSALSAMLLRIRVYEFVKFDTVGK